MVSENTAGHKRCSHGTVKGVLISSCTNGANCRSPKTTSKSLAYKEPLGFLLADAFILKEERLVSMVLNKQPCTVCVCVC